MSKELIDRLSQINPAPILEQVQQELERASQLFFEKCSEAMGLAQRNAVLTLQLYHSREEVRDLKNALAQANERANYWQKAFRDLDDLLKGHGVKQQ